MGQQGIVVYALIVAHEKYNTDNKTLKAAKNSKTAKCSKQQQQQMEQSLFTCHMSSNFLGLFFADFF